MIERCDQLHLLNKIRTVQLSLQLSTLLQRKISFHFRPFGLISINTHLWSEDG
jgi:hypothetical protein